MPNYGQPWTDHLRAADLNKVVTCESPVEISDGHDGLITAWLPVAPERRPAAVLPLQGRELERARQVDPRISHDVILRYWPAYPADLKGGRSQIVYHDVTDRRFEIVTPPIDVEEAHVFLRMQCRELV